MAESPDDPSRLELERWLLDELPPERRERVERALSPERREQLRSDDRALRERLLREHPSAEFAARVRARAQKQTERRAVWFALPMVAAAAAFLLLRAPDQTGPIGATTDSVTNVGSERVKGLTPVLHVYRRRGDRVERLADGASARAHDLLQLSYVAAGRSHGALLSIDGLGSVTLHLPADPASAGRLEPQGERLLPSAYELDAAPRYERFFLVTAEQPFSVDAVLEAARALASDPNRAERERLPLAAELEQRSLLIRKEESQ